MSTPVRVGLFVLALAVVFGGAAGLGAALGPDADPRVSQGAHERTAGHTSGGHESHVAGLERTQAGHTLELSTDRLPAGRQVLSFTIVGPQGAPLASYDRRHEQDLHLVAVRRDLTGFQHVHPTFHTGTTSWSTGLDLTPGAWRVLADFAPAGEEPLVLGADLLVPGAFTPEALGEDRLADTVGEYDVTLAGHPEAGEATTLELAVSRAGEPVQPEPYLGADGHLVALRDGDLGYLHVHPEETDGPAIAFAAEFPTPGRYRLFLDFKHDGVVRTAAFTVTVPAEGEHSHEH